MKLAVIAIGIPGSGKTTLLVPLAERHGLVRISRDDIRKELLGDPLNRTEQEQIWKEADSRMRAALTAGSGVVLDSTFTLLEKRTKAIADARVAGAERIIGVVFNTSPETAKERNAVREHTVRDEAIDISYERLTAEPPSINDGFDALYTNDQIAEIEQDIQEHSN